MFPFGETEYDNWSDMASVGSVVSATSSAQGKGASSSAQEEQLAAGIAEGIASLSEDTGGSSSAQGKRSEDTSDWRCAQGGPSAQEASHKASGTRYLTRHWADGPANFKNSRKSLARAMIG